MGTLEKQLIFIFHYFFRVPGLVILDNQTGSDLPPILENHWNLAKSNDFHGFSWKSQMRGRGDPERAKYYAGGFWPMGTLEKKLIFTFQYFFRIPGLVILDNQTGSDLPPSFENHWKFAKSNDFHGFSWKSKMRGWGDPERAKDSAGGFWSIGTLEKQLILTFQYF